MKKTLTILLLFFELIIVKEAIIEAQERKDETNVYREFGLVDSLLTSYYDSLQLYVETDLFQEINSKGHITIDTSIIYSYNEYVLKMALVSRDTFLLINKGEYPVYYQSIMSDRKTRKKYLKFMGLAMPKMQIPFDAIDVFEVSFDLYLNGIDFLHAQYKVTCGLDKIGIITKKIDYF